MQFVDTHTHLYDEAFKGEEDAAVERAVASGVTKMVFPDISQPTRQAMFDLADRHPGNVFPCLGLHPTELSRDWQRELDETFAFPLDGRRIYAIGEIGMDLYWSRELLSEQAAAFDAQLSIAGEKGLPVIIHAREATAPILDIVRAHKGLRGIFHAYSGSIETYREIQRLGDWYVGIGGVLTFKKASIAQTVVDIPLERIVLETDSPYLTPVPHRGERNESSYVPLIAGRLAEILGRPVEEIASATTRNAETLFGI